jgi:hypothetical protein
VNYPLSVSCDGIVATIVDARGRTVALVNPYGSSCNASDDAAAKELARAANTLAAIERYGLKVESVPRGTQGLTWSADNQVAGIHRVGRDLAAVVEDVARTSEHRELPSMEG